MSFVSRVRLGLWFIALLLALGPIADLPLHAADLPGDYFPDGKFNRFEIDEWWGKDLAVMGEPSLYKISKKDASAEVYRFTYFPCYDPVVALRLEIKPDGSGLLELRKVEQIEEQGGYGPGCVIQRTSFAITKRRVNHFLACVKEINFWNQPTDNPHREDENCLGGVEWLYEGAKRGGYHVIHRADCGQADLAFERPGEYLMKLIGQWK